MSLNLNGLIQIVSIISVWRKLDLTMSHHQRSKSSISNIPNDLLAHDNDSLAYDPDNSHQINPTRFKIYAVLDVIKFMIIGGVIFYINYNHQLDLVNNRSKYCCDCYYVAMDSKSYDIPTQRRVDWSYCTPDCTNCSYCASEFPTPGQAFNYSNSNPPFNECRIKDYQPPKNTFWKAFEQKYSKHSDCPSSKQLSMVTLELFNKSYYTYAIGAIVIVVLYAILIYSFINCCKIISGVNLLLYNIIISEILFYLMFKPYQYYKRKLYDPTPGSDYFAYCQIDALPEIMETILTIFIYCCLGFILLEWMLCLCRCCWNRWRYKYREYYWRFERVLIAFIIIVCLLFFGFLIWSSVLMIIERVNNEDDDKENELRDEIIVIVCIDIALLFSCVDIFLFKFCRDKARRLWNVRKKNNKHDYYLKYGRSQSSLSGIENENGYIGNGNNTVDADRTPARKRNNKMSSNIGAAIVEEKEDDEFEADKQRGSSIPNDYKYKYYASTNEEFTQEIK